MGDRGRELWEAADAYDRYMGRWSRMVAPRFLEWLAAPPGRRWLDVGSGTGELSRQIARSCGPSELMGIDSSEAFVAYARQHVPGAAFLEGDATRIDFPDGAFDYAVSGLVLNFLSDPVLALREMARVVCPGGTVALYVWDYAGHMQIMRCFFDAARAIDPESENYDDGIKAPVCRPKPLLDAFASAGLVGPETTAIDITAAFVDFEDYWAPFLGRTGSAPRYCRALDDAVRDRIREAVRSRLPTGPDGEILLAVRAWAAKGRVPGAP